jgi:hypothetical protein
VDQAMETIEIKLSDIIIHNPQINSFNELLEAVHNMKADDVLFLNFDVKPDFRDTPRNWQWRLEAAFS